MKKWFLILFIVITAAYYAYSSFKVTSNPATTNGIKFHGGSWDEAMKIEQKEKKLIFLDIYASWCGPCKLLKKNTFSNLIAAKFYNQNFVNVSLDGEKGEGMKIAKNYDVRGYPTLLFIDANGKIVAQATGYLGPEEFTELGNKVLKK